MSEPTTPARGKQQPPAQSTNPPTALCQQVALTFVLGQTPVKPRSNFGPTPVKPQSNPGQTPVKPWSNSGQTHVHAQLPHVALGLRRRRLLGQPSGIYRVHIPPAGAGQLGVCFAAVAGVQDGGYQVEVFGVGIEAGDELFGGGVVAADTGGPEFGLGEGWDGLGWNGTGRDARVGR